jgi:hypothetical protein
MKPFYVTRSFGNPLVMVKKLEMVVGVTFGLLLVGSQSNGI